MREILFYIGLASYTFLALILDLRELTTPALSDKFRVTDPLQIMRETSSQASPHSQLISRYCPVDRLSSDDKATKIPFPPPIVSTSVIASRSSTIGSAPDGTLIGMPKNTSPEGN